MIRTLVINPGAEDDIADAYRWYEARARGLGSRLLGELDATFERIVAHPHSYSEVEAGIRKSLVHTFPYLVFYTVDERSVFVLAVIHAAQDPAYISERLGA